MVSPDEILQSLEKEQMHDVMIYIDENDIDVKYKNIPRDQNACNSGHGPEENVCPNVVIPLVEIRDVSNGGIPNPSPEESNDSKKNIRLKGGDDNNSHFNTYGDQFKSKETRRQFIKKVYTIITIMLVVVASPSLLFHYSIEAREVQIKYFMLIFVQSMFVFLITFYALTCYEHVRKSVPTNFIVLTLYSASLGFTTSCIIIQYRMDIVIMALMYTTGVVLMITLLAAYCPIDITKFGILITVMGMIVMLFTFITYLFLVLYYHEVKLGKLIMGAVGVLVMSIFLAYNTQLVLGGGKYEITPDEYILAVVIILTNIVDIFYYMLLLLSGGD